MSAKPPKRALEYKTVKVPKSSYDTALGIQTRVTQKGLESSPELVALLRENTCPRCNVELEQIPEAYAGVRLIHECPKCGISKPVADIEYSTREKDIVTIIGLGALVTLGLYLVAKALK